MISKSDLEVSGGRVCVGVVVESQMDKAQHDSERVYGVIRIRYREGPQHRRHDSEKKKKNGRWKNTKRILINPDAF